MFSEAATNPCNGEAGTIAAVSTNEVFHVTSQTDGDFWLTGTTEGIITFTPDEAGGVSASGHFAVWFGVAKNNRNELEHNTFNAHMTATDGSHIAIHMDAHTSTNALGEVKVSFENMRMTCAS